MVAKGLQSSDHARSRTGPRFDLRGSVARSQTLGLLRAGHPRQALVTALALALAGAFAGRGTDEVLLVLATVLVGQFLLGWHNDLVDRELDASHDRNEKPLVSGPLEPGTVWFAVALGVLVVIPLSIGNGVIAGLSYLGVLVIAVATNEGLLRRTALSPLSWMASFALLPAYLSYGGLGGGWEGVADAAPPTILICVAAALLGAGVHFLVSLPGLVTDNADGIKSLPLRVALKIGAPKLLVLTIVWLVLVTAGIVAVGLTVGLRQ